MNAQRSGLRNVFMAVLHRIVVNFWGLKGQRACLY